MVLTPAEKQRAYRERNRDAIKARERGRNAPNSARYWAKNKDRINATRREKYHNDPEYRESVLSANRASKKKMRKAK